jgi:hypothetical protein
MSTIRSTTIPSSESISSNHPLTNNDTNHNAQDQENSRFGTFAKSLKVKTAAAVKLAAEKTEAFKNKAVEKSSELWNNSPKKGMLVDPRFGILDTL